MIASMSKSTHSNSSQGSSPRRVKAPEPFLWGVATSAYQSEGGFNGPDQPRTNWAQAEELGQVAHTGAAADFLTRFEEDFAAARRIGLNAFRLGIEWSRVQPASHPSHVAPPDFDSGALNRYADMIASCQRHGLEPVVTLHHFVHPEWLGADAWLQKGTAEHFQRFCKHALHHINSSLVTRPDARPIKWIVTINEPNMLVLNTYFGRQFPSGADGGVDNSMAAYGNLLAAHTLAYNAIHDLYEEKGWPSPLVAFNTYSSDVYWSEKMLYDIVSAPGLGVERSELNAHICGKAAGLRRALAEARMPFKRDLPYQFGLLVKWLSNRLGSRRFEAESLAPALDALYASPRARVLDYIGIDYYDPFLAHSIRLPRLADIESRDRSLRAWMINSVTSKWWDWRVLPEGLHFFCDHYSREYGLPVLIAENGMALYRSWHNHILKRRDRMTRSRFLELFVRTAASIRAEGIPLAGYLHWSMFDNYEWGSYTPRFGLFSIDFAHGTERLVEDHSGDRPSETYSRLLAELRGDSGEGEGRA